MTMEEITANKNESVQEQKDSRENQDNSCSCEESEKMEKELSSQDAEIIRLNKEIDTALKIAINEVYGESSAHFDNLFRDPRNIDNIVAKLKYLFR